MEKLPRLTAAPRTASSPAFGLHWLAFLQKFLGIVEKTSRRSVVPSNIITTQIEEKILLNFSAVIQKWSAAATTAAIASLLISATFGCFAAINEVESGIPHLTFFCLGSLYQRSENYSPTLGEFSSFPSRQSSLDRLT